MGETHTTVIKAQTWLAMVLTLVGCSAKTTPDSALVFPQEAAALKPVQLSEIVYLAMPPADASGFGWETLMAGPVRWMTDGIGSDPRGHSLRRGLARIRVKDAAVFVLKRAWTEQAWSIRLVGGGNDNLGPSTILVTPSEDYECEYASYKGCDFKASDALNSPKFDAQSICSGESLPTTFEVFRIEAKDKRPIYAEVVSVGRSERGGSWLQLTTENPGCALDPNVQESVDQPVSSDQQDGSDMSEKASGPDVNVEAGQDRPR